jgi:hypothetical protein
VDAVRTPLDHGTALALGNKIYRKQVLRSGPLHYRGGTFDVTDAYLDSVVAAFDAKAIPRVPFQLADASNTHTEDPLRRFGTVTALHRTPDGLDAVIELDDEAARLVDNDPEFGVSVLIKHDRTTGEGAKFPAVLAHVLGTTDPVLTQLAPWQPELAASNDSGDVLDLLALTSAPRDDKEGPTMAEAITLTPEETAQLRSLLPKLAALQAEPTPDAPADTVEPAEREYTDEELQAMADSVLDDDADLPVEEPLAASHNDEQVLALSQRLEAAEQARRDDALALSQLREERDESLYLSQRDEWARKYGVHPTVTDIVKPLLKGGDRKLALSNGTELDAAALITKFVHEIATRPRLDLSQAKGTAVDVDDNADEATERDALAKLAIASLR